MSRRINTSDPSEGLRQLLQEVWDWHIQTVGRANDSHRSDRRDRSGRRSGDRELTPPRFLRRDSHHSRIKFTPSLSNIDFRSCRRSRHRSRESSPKTSHASSSRMSSSSRVTKSTNQASSDRIRSKYRAASVRPSRRPEHNKSRPGSRMNDGTTKRKNSPRPSVSATTNRVSLCVSTPKPKVPPCESKSLMPSETPELVVPSEPQQPDPSPMEISSPAPTSYPVQTAPPPKAAPVTYYIASPSIGQVAALGGLPGPGSSTSPNVTTYVLTTTKPDGNGESMNLTPELINTCVPCTNDKSECSVSEPTFGLIANATSNPPVIEYHSCESGPSQDTTAANDLQDILNMDRSIPMDEEAWEKREELLKE